MARKKTEFQVFLDGLVDFYELDDSRKPTILQKGIRFADRVVGSKRNYLAMQAGATIQKLIRVPMWDPDPDSIRAGMFAVIRGKQYKILQAQKIPDVIPLSMDLTLENPDILLDFREEEAGAGGRC